MIFFVVSNEWNCAHICTKSGSDSCSNFVDTPSTKNCKTITDGGQGLVKTSPFNQKAVKVWSTEILETGL